MNCVTECLFGVQCRSRGTGGWLKGVLLSPAVMSTIVCNVAWLGTGKQEIIRGCEDWLVVWDEDKFPAMFPPEIVTTSRSPDITTYSPSEKQCIITELTVPAEENLAQTNVRKKLEV